MALEYASPELANLIAARLRPEELERRLRAPLTDAEVQETAELVEWFMRRYPTPKDRLEYARRKLDQIVAGAALAGAPVARDYLETARRLARAHRSTDPRTEAVLLDPDPDGQRIKLVEITPASPRQAELVPVWFAARPDLGVPFVVAVLLLAPEDWEAVGRGDLELPSGWSAERLVAL